MKQLFTALALSAALLGAQAADDTKPAPKKSPSAQQTKMATCNKDAAGKSGDDRKAFMKDCLSAKAPSQKDKMTLCNKDATGKTGDARKAFMKECLSAKT